MPTCESQSTIIESLLASQSTLSLATVEDHGAPRVTPLFYVAAGLRLYWFSSARSTHSRNLKKRPAVFAAIYPCTYEWREIRGLQMRGTASAVADRALRKSIAAAYRERFRLGAMFEARLSHSTLYEFRPAWVRCVDNSRGVGYKFEIATPALADGAPPNPAARRR